MHADARSAVNGVAASEIQAALTRVLQSDAFVRSSQLQRLLRFLVEETLAGRGDALKEYVIGVEVFGRPSSYDPRIDSLVRVEARRLRTALETYYHEQGGADPVVIELPKGSYVPLFRRAIAIEAPCALPAADEQKPVSGIDDGHATVPKLGLGRRRRGALVAGAATVIVLALVVAFSSRSRPVQALTERDSIVLAGFDNSTGEPIFDDTLKQGLTVELEQSPFLNIVSDRRTAQVLKLMGRSPTEPLNPELARELCLRSDSKATVTGSITPLGSEYVIGLTASNCSTGDSFAHVQVQAASRETVLTALGTAASAMRSKLGESLHSIQKFDVPIEDATTPSLQALEAFSLGRKTAREKGSPADIPFYKRAIEIDPNFAVAYAALGVSYVNLGQPSVGGEYVKRAYELRDRVSQREKYRISAYYHHIVTGELEKAAETYELWKQSYPRDFAPYINLGVSYSWLGEYEKSAAVVREALRLEPTNVLPYTNLAAQYIKLGRPDEAQAMLDQARARNLTSKFLRSNVCYLAFLRNDAATMEQQLAEVKDKPGDEDPLLSQQADTEAYYGRLKKAREFSRRAVESATRAGANEAAAGWLVNAALREAEFGNTAAARREVQDALRLSPGRDVVAVAALALARVGEFARAEALLRDLETSYPRNTVIRVYWAPSIRAAIHLGKGDATGALELLQGVAPYELGSPPPTGLATLHPVYLRGQAYLLDQQGDAAAREFQKILDHPGLVLNFPLHALARVQLGRARALGGERPAARQAYDNFFAIWKDADADIPILRQARAEYARLR